MKNLTRRCIGSDDFREKVWPLPVQELLYVGNATYRKLKGYGIHTIGQLGQTEPETLKYWFGVIGVMLWQFANGLDASRVCDEGYRSVIKSVGNSTTTPRDLTARRRNNNVIFSGGKRSGTIEGAWVYCWTVQFSVRENKLISFERQTKLRSRYACLI
jgi:DNA polymerase-4